MSGDTLILFLIGFPMIGGMLSFIIGKRSKTARNYIANSIVIVEFIAILFLYQEVIAQHRSITFQWDSFSGQGVFFIVDGFRFIYCSITAFAWMMVTLFSGEYFKNYRNRNRYYAFNLLTLGATMGVFLSADLFTTFIFFEIMSLSSFVWVIHDEEKDSLNGGQVYLAFSIIGGLVMLMGIFLIQDIFGTLEISQLLEKATALEDKTILYVAGISLFVGFGIKAGVFPLHSWLPKAYSVAPAPASALLSSVLSKTGVYGILIISCFLFYGNQMWGYILLVMGVTTMVLGAVLALLSIDLKRTLACSSMSQIGFIVVGISMHELLGETSSIAIRGVFLHMINHSFIKLVLFMVAGVVFMNIQKHNLNEIQGFGRKKPLLNFMFLMGGLGVAGVPLWNGYISKTLLHESIVEYIVLLKEGIITSEFINIQLAQGLEYVFLFSGGMTVAYILKLYVCLFIQKNNDCEIQENYDKNSKQYMNWISKFALLGSAILLPIMGLFPTQIMDGIANTGQEFLNGKPLAHEVDYFNMVNLKGGMTSIGIGIFLYLVVVLVFLRKKDEQGKRVYCNYWPDWIDIEARIYRPTITVIVPFLGKILARAADGVVDSLVVGLRKTLYSDRKIPEELVEGSQFTYFVGGMVDMVRRFKNRTFHTHSRNAVSYRHRFAVLRDEFRENNTIIARSLSFGLFMFSVGLSVTLLYILFL